MKFFAFLLFLAFATTAVFSTSDYEGCSGKINTEPVILMPAEWIFNVTNGAKYLYRYDEKNYIYLIKVRGSAKEMGVAYGQLMKDELNDIVPEVFDYYEKVIE